MMNADLAYVKNLIEKRIVRGNVLELGAGYGGSTCRSLVMNSLLPYFSTDLPGCPGQVDFHIDFLDSESAQLQNRFDSILVLNVLEHVFNPVMLLDNASSLLAEEGVMVLLSPVCWQIHRYPVDCNRLLPDFYREYARRRNLEIIADTFIYVESATSIPVECGGADESLPRIQSRSKVQKSFSRFIHAFFRTDGRPIYTLPVAQEAIAVCMKKS